MQHVRSVAGMRVDCWNYGRNGTIHADVMPWMRASRRTMRSGRRAGLGGGVEGALMPSIVKHSAEPLHQAHRTYARATISRTGLQRFRSRSMEPGDSRHGFSGNK